MGIVRTGGRFTPGWLVAIVIPSALFFWGFAPFLAVDAFGLPYANQPGKGSLADVLSSCMSLLLAPVVIVPYFLTKWLGPSTPARFEFFLDTFYVLQVLVFSLLMFPVSWKHIFYNFVAMTSGDPNMTGERAQARAEIVKQERHLGGEIDHIRTEVRALSRQLPGAPEPPATLLEFGSYLEQLRKQAQSYVQGKTLERQNAVLQQMTVYYTHWLKLEQQMDEIRSIGTTREIRDLEREVAKEKLQHEKEKLAAERERIKRQTERERHPHPKPQPPTAVDRLLKEAKTLIELKRAMEFIRVQYKDELSDSEIDELVQDIYLNERRRLTRSND